MLTGQYSYSDQGGDADPSLSDPDINWRSIPHQLNKRGTNIEGADVQWGDGTTHKIFMPGTKDTVYINLHMASGVRSRLTFAYNGPVASRTPAGKWSRTSGCRHAVSSSSSSWPSVFAQM